MNYRINTPAVVADVIDGEAIIINLDSGRYYSMEGSGAYLWSALSVGSDVEAIIQGISAHAGESVSIADDVRGFIDQLLAEALVCQSIGAAVTPELPSYTEAYKPPILHIFTDMQSMLLLDPIHKVDDAGWPHPASE